MTWENEYWRTLVDPNADDMGEDSPASRLPESGRRQILYDWNSTDSEIPLLCAHQLFEQQVLRDPDAVAVVFNQRQLSYAELNQRANQIAHYLQSLGVGPERLVGVCLQRSPEMVAALLGVWKAGGAYVPLDPSYPQERLAFMVQDAAVQVLLTEKSCEHLFSSAHPNTVCLDTDWPRIACEQLSNPDSGATPANLAYVMYTSGSTGTPKGAMILHRGLVNYLTWAIRNYAVEPGGSVPVHSSISFDLTVTSLYTPLLAGAQVELLAEDVAAQSLLTALRRVQNRTLVKITPAHLELLSQQLSPQEIAEMTKTFVIGGENLSAEKLRMWREFAPSTRLINEYGPTETVVGCCVYEVQPGDPASGTVPIGRPIANTQLYVLDSDLQPVALGETGELYIGGAGVARGYWNRPELTRERFVPDPFSGQPDARLYKSGDLARYRPDGTLECLGRADNQVKVRGYRIELGEIEATLAGHAGVQSCAVLAREDDPGNQQLVAYVSPVRDQSPEPKELRAFLNQRLPEYMVPAHFVFLESLPLTPNGKIDRKALRDPSHEGVPPTVAFVAPRTETEKTLAAIWLELLKLDQIGVNDSFFELGGHSLLAIRAVSRIRDLFEVDLPAQILFENSTIAELAPLLANSEDKPEVFPANVTRIPRRTQAGPYPLSAAQEQLWFLSQLAPGSPAYNIVDLIPLDGAYDAEALRKTIREMVRRHEILRTAFSYGGGQPMQEVAPTLNVELQEVDLSGLPEVEQEREWLRVVHQEGRKTFDLSRLPLFRGTVIHRSAQDHKLLLVIHHIIADEWAMEVIHKEVAQLYAAFSLGQPPSLPELPIQYADVACWQQERLQSEELQKQLAYWKKELAGAPAVLDLATDKPRPALQSFLGATELFQLPENLLPRLRSLCREEHATLFMILEAAFAALLHRYTGQDDILVGTPISGRTQSETENLIGCFLNTIILRAQFSESLTFRGLLQQVRERALGAYAHADLAFNRLVAELAPERDSSRSPLSQAMFVQHAPDAVCEIARVSAMHQLATGTSKFDLTLFISEAAEDLQGLIEYNTDLFEPSTIRQLGQHYATLLEAIVSNPDQSVAQLPMLADDLRRQPAPTRAVAVKSDFVAPRDATEQLLAQIWANVLKVKRVGLHDNFFDLGGHSLLAVRIMVEIEKHTNIRLPLATLLHAPTIADMAETLRNSQWVPSWSSLVPLRASGSKPPLFLIHAHGGNVLEYHALASHLEADQPVYALQARGLDGNIPRDLTLEKMAAAYLEEIRLVQPEGPYFLAGFCFGGLLALEAAQQLRNAGQQVALVLLIQTMNPEVYLAIQKIPALRRWWYQLIKQFDLEAENLSNSGSGYILERCRRAWDMIHARLAIARDQKTGRRSADPSNLPRLYIFETLGMEHSRALAKYVPQPYDGNVVLFRASKQLRGQESGEYLGWEPLFRGHVEVCEVPGHQQNLMLEPNVRPLASAITAQLKAVQQRHDAAPKEQSCKIAVSGA